MREKWNSKPQCYFILVFHIIVKMDQTQLNFATCLKLQRWFLVWARSSYFMCIIIKHPVLWKLAILKQYQKICQTEWQKKLKLKCKTYLSNKIVQNKWLKEIQSYCPLHLVVKSSITLVLHWYCIAILKPWYCIGIVLLDKS
jgi:hypothetical protein